jgi:hypothetical protein
MRPHIALTALTIGLAACSSGSPPVAQPSILPVAITSPSPSVSPSPSIDQSTDPRIDGRYVVVKKVTGVRNFRGTHIGDVLHRTYHVRPSCPIGPCGGSIHIDLAESKKSLNRTFTYDAAAHTYTLVPIVSPVICTGVDGKRYKLKRTTDTVVLTPVKTAPTGVDMVVTRWTGEEILRAVPDGRALNKGHCRIAELKYSYTGTLT